MRRPQAAISARGSAAHQAAAHTVASPVAALRERVAAAGLAAPEARQCSDEGDSGAPLGRPALAQRRDLIAAGAVARLSVHAPDRLARQYADPVRPVGECPRAGVEVLCLNRELGRGPEDEVRLQVQGMTAASARAQVIARHRRGKRQAARAGVVHGLSGAPYG